MTISTEEAELIRQINETAARKYAERIDTLHKTMRIYGYDALTAALGRAARWMYNHVDDPALVRAHIKVVDRGEDLYRGHVTVQLDGGRFGSIKIEYNHERDPYVVLPDNPARTSSPTATDAADRAEWTLARLDEFIQVAERYVKVEDDVRDRDLNNSRNRAAKVRSRLELLEKL